MNRVLSGLIASCRNIKRDLRGHHVLGGFGGRVACDGGLQDGGVEGVHLGEDFTAYHVSVAGGVHERGTLAELLHHGVQPLRGLGIRRVVIDAGHVALLPPMMTEQFALVLQKPVSAFLTTIVIVLFGINALL